MLRRLLALFVLLVLLRLAVSQGSSQRGVATVEGVGDTSVGRVWMAPSDMECMRSIGDRAAR